MQIALYQPDIPQNTGTILRLGACLCVPVHLIEPAGFSLSAPAMKRAGMDYLEIGELVRHRSFDDFLAARGQRRIVLLTTAAADSHTGFAFRADDIVMLGRESAGVPDAVHDLADARIKIPMRREARSLNVALAAAIAVGEALRQTGGFPSPAS